jgi:hypothetical protein
MVLNMQECISSFKNKGISISYSGPMWGDGVRGIAEMVRTRLAFEDLPKHASKVIFSVFVEQVTNMLMYSAEKESCGDDEKEEVGAGMLVLGQKGKTYFIQTGNAIKKESVGYINGRIEHLNSLDKKELRQYHKEMMRSENSNPESKGGGLGLIEIARRASSPIGYSFEEVDEKLSYFSMYVEIMQEEM